MVSIRRKQPLVGASASSLCFLVGLLSACGSADSASLSQTSRGGGAGAMNVSGSGGSTFGGAPGLGGIPFGNGGVPFGAGGIIVGTGGSIGAGGFFVPNGTGGFVEGAGGAGTGGLGAGGADPGTGGSLDAGTFVNPFPSGFGFLISPACSDCASLNCQAEERVCAADPACAAVGQCIATCLGPTCLACITTLSNQTTYNEFTAVTRCTDQKCQPTCPFLNL